VSNVIAPPYIGSTDHRTIPTGGARIVHYVPAKPLYDARLENLTPGDLVKVECACGRVELIPPVGFLQGMRLSPDTLVPGLAPRMRCRECDARGKAVVSVRG